MTGEPADASGEPECSPVGTSGAIGRGDGRSRAASHGLLYGERRPRAASNPTIGRPPTEEERSVAKHKAAGGTVAFDEDGDLLWHNAAGELHREDGPAAEEPDGSRSWWTNGSLHRDGGPAVECADGSRLWWMDSRLHRADGPAVELANGRREWWLEGEQLSKAAWRSRTRDP
jgi:hypothetical protein